MVIIDVTKKYKTFMHIQALYKLSLIKLNLNKIMLLMEFFLISLFLSSSMFNKTKEIEYDKKQ